MVRSFPRVKQVRMTQYVKPAINNNPFNIIIHFGGINFKNKRVTGGNS